MTVGMPLITKTYEQYLSDIITSWISILFSAGIVLSPNLQSGDPLLAIFQSHVLAGLMFIQAEAVAVNKLTRAATSDGPDLDSWVYDFGVDRKPAVSASGQVQFSLRVVSNSDILIPAGKIIQTADGSIQYQTIADTNQAAWSVSDNAYLLPAHSLSINASVQALVPGSASNVQIGYLNQMASSITGVNFVKNLAAIENGADPEADQPLRDRFKLFNSSARGPATPGGAYYAAISTPGVVSVSLVENFDRFGNPRPGYMLLVIDDGSGAPSSDLIATVTENIQPVRGATIQYLVIGPTRSVVNIALSVKINPAALSSAVVRAVETAVIDYVNSLEIGDTLYLENLSYIAKGADPNVIAVEKGSVLINSLPVDFIATSQTVIRTNNGITTIGTW